MEPSVTLLLALLVGFVGCGDGSQAPDSGAPDAGGFRAYVRLSGASSGMLAVKLADGGTSALAADRAALDAGFELAGTLEWAALTKESIQREPYHLLLDAPYTYTTACPEGEAGPHGTTTVQFGFSLRSDGGTVSISTDVLFPPLLYGCGGLVWPTPSESSPKHLAQDVPLDAFFDPDAGVAARFQNTDDYSNAQLQRLLFLDETLTIKRTP
jgi:hypothetical protein